MTEAVLKVQSVTKIFTNSDKPRLKVLDGVSLDLMRNEIVGVIGPARCHYQNVIPVVDYFADLLSTISR